MQSQVQSQLLLLQSQVCNYLHNKWFKKKGQVQTPSGKHVTVYHNNVQTCEHIKEAV